MSNITISNLQPVDLNLFSDEGYLNDLDESEQNIQGGIWNTEYVYYLDSSGGWYGGVHDYDHGVSEPINSSGG